MQVDKKPVHPYVDLRIAKEMEDEDGYNRVGINSLADHLGIPVTQLDFESGDADMRVSALPFAAMQKIWLDYYCDKNVQQELIDEYYHTTGELQDGDNTRYYPTLFTLHHRMWRKDYFTSALPDAQRGADVLIPVNGGDVDIRFNQTGAADRWSLVGPGGIGVQWQDFGQQIWNNDEGGESKMYPQLQSNAFTQVNNAANLKGELSSFNSTITDLRTAFATQRLLELSMRVGSRLKEQLLGIFGVKSSDARLDRAEFIGTAIFTLGSLRGLGNLRYHNRYRRRPNELRTV